MDKKLVVERKEIPQFDFSSLSSVFLSLPRFFFLKVTVVLT